MELETLTSCLSCHNEHLDKIDPSADLCKCPDCGYVFVNPRPTVQSIIEYYSKPTKYDIWISEEKARDALWLRRLRKMRKFKRAGSLLDVGTGIGQFLFKARSFYERVFGTEISESAILVGREKYGMEIMQGELASLSFNQKFDNISLFHILEHVPDPKLLLKKCHNLLSEKGILTIAVPNDLLSWELKVRTMIKKVKNNIKGGSNNTYGKYGIPRIVLDGTVDEIHLSQFTPESLSRMVKDAGLDILDLSLDPYFAKTGWKLIAHHFHYTIQSLLNRMAGLNRYNTIWLVAKKNYKDTNGRNSPR